MVESADSRLLAGDVVRPPSPVSSATSDPVETRLPCPSHVLLPDGSRYAVTYAVVRLGDVVTSHRARGRAAVPDARYPRRVQHRTYSGARGREAFREVLRAGQQLIPDLLLDMTATPQLGPPVVAGFPAPTGGELYVCVAGNHRAMSLRYAVEFYDAKYRAYHAALLGVAPFYGVDLDTSVRAWGTSDPSAAAVDDAPVLVRVLDRRELPASGPALRRALGRLNRASDGTFTKARDAVTAALTIANELRYLERDALAPGGGGAPRSGRDSASDLESPLGHLAATLVGGTTLGQYLRTEHGREFFRKIVRSGAVGSHEEVLYTRAGTDALSAAGRAALEAVVHAVVFRDPEVLEVTPGILLMRLQSSFAALLELSAYEAWDLSAPLGRALRILGQLARARAANGTGPHTLRDYLDQLAVDLASSSPPVDEALVGGGGSDGRTHGDLATGESDGEPADPRLAARERMLAIFLDDPAHTAPKVRAAVADWLAAAHASGARAVSAELSLFDGLAEPDPPEAQFRAADAAFAQIFGGVVLPEPDVARARRGALAGLPMEDYKEYVRLFFRLVGDGSSASGVTDAASREGIEMLRRPRGRRRTTTGAGVPHPSNSADDGSDLWGSPVLLSDVEPAVGAGSDGPALHGDAGPVARRAGRPRRGDAEVFAALCFAHARRLELDDLDAFGLLPSGRTCRRRVRAWRRNPDLIRALGACSALPPWVFAGVSKKARRRRPSSRSRVSGASETSAASRGGSAG